MDISLDRIRVVANDSAITPKDNGSYSSRVTFMVGNAAIEAAKNGIPTYVIDEIPIIDRDFTDGKATQMLYQLKDCGAIFVKNQAEILTLLKE